MGISSFGFTVNPAPILLSKQESTTPPNVLETVSLTNSGTQAMMQANSMAPFSLRTVSGDLHPADNFFQSRVFCSNTYSSSGGEIKLEDYTTNLSGDGTIQPLDNYDENANLILTIVWLQETGHEVSLLMNNQKIVGISYKGI